MFTKFALTRAFEARMNARSSTCTRSRQHGVAQRADIHAAKQSKPYFASVMFSESRMSAFDPLRTLELRQRVGGVDRVALLAIHAAAD